MGHLDAETFAGRLADADDSVLIIGSAVSLPIDGQPGVPGARQMVERARAAVKDRLGRQAKFREAVDKADNPYQAAFQFITETCGPRKTNQVICEAVLEARNPGASKQLADLDGAGWHLTPRGPRSGAKGVVLTTNFDPLIQVAIRRAGGQCDQTVLARDGSLRRRG